MSIKVDLTSAIYPIGCVLEAASAYKGYCEINMVSQHASGCLIEIIPSPEIEDTGQLTNEFLNYLLDLSLEKHLEAARV